MADAARRVLLIVGDSDAAQFVSRALVHPFIETEAFAAGEDFAGDLASTSFDAALVGGTVGSRGPFVLCEAVRMTRQVPIVVLVDSTTNPRALAAHQGLKAELVDYLDFDGFSQADGSLVDVGTRLRAQVLERLAVAEDRATAAAWKAWLEKAQAERDAARPPLEPQPAMVGGASPADADVEGEDATAAEEAPPLLTQMVGEDLDFANRIVERTKSVDFRSEVEPAGHPADSGDAKTQKLRERIRELERQLARLAFVYRTRQREFDGADETATRLEQARKEAETRVAELQQEYQNELQQRTGSSQQREQEFKAMLTQAEQAFNQLKTQSTQAIQHAQHEVAARQHELDTARAHIEELRERLESAVSAQSVSVSQREEQAHQSVERERQALADLAAAEQRLADEREARAAERAEWAVREDVLTDEVGSVSSQLEVERAARQESESQREALVLRVAELETDLDKERQRAQEVTADVATAWAEKSEKLKESAATFRDAYHEHEKALREREATIESLNARLEDRADELARLKKALSGKSDDIKALEKVVENGLKELRQQLGKQEIVLDTLVATHDAGPKGSNVKLAQWVSATTSRLVAAACGTVLVTAVVVALATSLLTGDAGGSSTAAALAAGREADTGANNDNAGADRGEPPAEPNEPPLAEIGATDDAEQPLAETAAADDTQQPAIEPAEPAAADAEQRGTETSGARPPAAEPTQAAGQKPKPGSDTERRAVRTQMFAALAKRRWAEAVEHGTRLRDEFHLDWEAAFKLGEALERSKRLADAAIAYVDFANRNATNKFAGEAWFRAGAIYLRSGDKGKARSCLEKAAASDVTHVASKAKSLLRKIK